MRKLVAISGSLIPGSYCKGPLYVHLRVLINHVLHRPSHVPLYKPLVLFYGIAQIQLIFQAWYPGKYCFQVLHSYDLLGLGIRLQYHLRSVNDYSLCCSHVLAICTSRPFNTALALYHIGLFHIHTEKLTFPSACLLDRLLSFAPSLREDVAPLFDAFKEWWLCIKSFYLLFKGAVEYLLARVSPVWKDSPSWCL